ncbi:uncharacterized protein EAE97_012136 [Botrytis byssoidea]|uniref:Zn(2)-C6 fungal-type domain-containing protein n=1 Tax=Botrytis byssoidea TaxID=139641 RepID=A0A9P5LF99_9HELO|nr:uncharacterized protein EAE97_012136 [Botrytis byssoidea]KAF7916258.1 hypothetical protein EAE97_012136 [Botrytis byssoidea]
MEATTEPQTSQSLGHTATHQSRACEQCHRRKIRCDRRFPCSNCQTANLSCRTLTRRLVLAQARPSTRNNEDIRFTRLEEQLSDIQQTLSMLQNSLVELKLPGHPSNSAEMREKLETTGKQHTAVVMKDGLSLPSPEMIAYEVKGNPNENSTPDISMEYSQLDKALNRNDPQSLLYDKSFPEIKTQEKSAGNIVMPPLTDIVLLLKWTKGPTNPTLLSFLPLVSISELDSLCKKAYFEMEECTTSDLIIINACLLFFMPEYCISQSKDDSVTARCRLNSLLCQKNLELAMSRLNLFMNLSLDNTKALILASMYAVGTHSLGMAWTLISTAARLCQSLGYNQLTVRKITGSSDENAKMALFRYVYNLDQTLSLRLGQPSSLQAMKNLAFLTLTAKSKNSKLEGQFCKSGASQHQYLGFVQHANDVVFLSLLTLIYRSIPSESSDTLSPFNQQCLEAAQAALAAHHSCYLNYMHKHKYIWTIYLQTGLACPIIPFLVMFCHAVTTLSLETMEDLEKFVTSLQPVNQAYIAGYKAHALCQRFYEAGKSYVETQLQRKREANMADTCRDLGASIFTDIIPEFWHALMVPITIRAIMN